MTKRPGEQDPEEDHSEKKPRLDELGIVPEGVDDTEADHSGHLLVGESGEVEESMAGTLIIQEPTADGTTIIHDDQGVLHTQDGVKYDTLQISAEDGSTIVMAAGEHLPEGVHQITEDGHVITSDGQVVMMEGGVVTAIEGSVEEVPSIIEGGIQEGVIQMETVDDNAIHIPVSQGSLEAVESQVIEDGEDGEDGSRYQNIIIQHMDISQPLTTLRKLLETRLSTSLADHEFYLQDTLPLEPEKNLVSQCVQGSGMVQINVEVKSHPGEKPRLNIVDILKPAEEVDVTPTVAPTPAVVSAPTPTKVVIPFPEESENVTRWIVDPSFRKEQERLKIPFDPLLWNETHVKHWIQWAVKEFNLVGVDINNFTLNGHQLCALKHNEFTQLIPQDKGDIFWTHLELLRKCKFVAVIQQPTPHAITTITVSTTNDLDPRMSKSFNRTPKVRGIVVPSERTTPGNRTGNNGQIQLWQFLLELLTDKDSREVIHWVGDEGEFKLNNPEIVAQLWGQRKNKPTMNYEKLSRALRYYYDGDMIAKVHGKRFVYKFVCDLQMLLGYNAGELNRLVTECAERKLQKVRESLRPGILRKAERT